MTNLDFLSEGGNVFKDAKGVATTQRINQTDVKPTVTWLEQLTGLQFLHADPQQDRLLGSTGLKSTSGDLDLAVDANAVTKEQLVGVLTTWAESHGFEPKDWIRKSGNSVHFKTPITGRPLNGFVQTDFMFLSNIAYSKFFLRTDPASSHSGSIRNIMLSSLAKALGYKINSTTGIVSRATDQLLSNDPDQIARLLLNKSATSKDLNSVENILKALANDPKKNAKLTDFRDYMTNAGIQFDESIEENEVGFLARLRDRIVNQGMTVIIEDNPINHYRLYEAADPRIPYIEDFVFKSGLRGARQAVDIVKQAADNAREYITIKWDGCIHPDLKIRTNKGVFRIEEVIDRYLSGEDFKVVAHDLETGTDVSININHAVKEFGNKSWVEIELENGEILRMTADHEVFTTNRGWVQAQHLTDSDDIKTSENN